jgi:hypothetical protein
MPASTKLPTGNSFASLIQFILDNLPQEDESFNKNYATSIEALNKYGGQLKEITLDDGDDGNLWERLRTLFLSPRKVAEPNVLEALKNLKTALKALQNQPSSSAGQSLEEKLVGLSSLYESLNYFESILHAEPLSAEEKKRIASQDPVAATEQQAVTAGTNAPGATDKDIYVVKLQKFMDSNPRNKSHSGEAWIQDVELVTKDGFLKGECRGIAVRIGSNAKMNSEQKRILAEEMMRFYVLGGGDRNAVIPLQGKDSELVMYAMAVCIKLDLQYEIRGHSENELFNKLLAEEKTNNPDIIDQASLRTEYKKGQKPFVAELWRRTFEMDKVRTGVYTQEPKPTEVQKLKRWYENEAFVKANEQSPSKKPKPNDNKDSEIENDENDGNKPTLG